MNKFALILMAVISQNLFAQKKAFDLQDIFVKGTFSMNFNGGFNTMNDGVRYTKLEKTDESWSINAYSIKDQKLIGSIIKSGDFDKKYYPASYEFTGDEKHILLYEGREKIYRHSFKSLAYVVNIESKKITKISDKKIMYPSVNPDNKSVAYVQENNIYILDLQSMQTKTVTSDGVKNQIINGAVDWVYEEEFSMSTGLWWNSTGTHLAYYRFDESAVKEFSMDMFHGLYPKQERWKYPKAGEDNSVVDVKIYSNTTGSSITLDLNSDRDQYIPRIAWTNNPDILSVQRLNRLQNHWELLFCNTSGASPELIIEEKNNTYVEISDNLSFIDDDKFFYTSEKSGFNHIYCYDFKKKNEKALTSGDWEVLKLVATDEKSSTIYYTSSEVSVLEDHLYSINFSGKKKKALTPEPGNHSISMANGNKYFIDNHSTFDMAPNFYLRSSDGKSKTSLVDNAETTNRFKNYQFGSSSFGTLTVNETELNYWMIKPHDFDPNKKYPLFMHVYGGPGHNTVSNSFGYTNYQWHNYLSSLGYIVISVDNRGTLKRGAQFKKSTYKQLGKLEHLDQSAVADHFGALDYIDKDRIGVWGWSFGGYLTSLCLTKSPDKFKMGIAVAPVTNWRYYDNIYTERFLQKPQDNKEGYDDNSPINFVDQMKGKYLIIHGTGDDNVHFQNSMEMVEAMIQANVSFDSEFYPNKNHGIYGGNTRYHLYQKMTNFVIENL